MFYDKKIKYLNYIVNGERIKGCGFLKVEVRDCVIHLEVVVSGLPPSLHAYTDVWVCTETATYSLGNIYLDNGGGSFRVSDSNLAEFSPMGVAYSEWKGIAIFPKEGSEISAYWEEQPKCVLERVEVSKELVVEMRPTPVSEQTAGEGSVSTESVPPETVEQERLETNVKSSEQEKTMQVRMAEGKWEQISEIYPHIRPFRDKREYLSIRPADFVLLSEDSYKAVNNSFLLHGYHNYQHLILARSMKKGKKSYYVGAPGNFFEREKQVAIMFGFTGFECARDPAREGDFGYYLMEVQM